MLKANENKYNFQMTKTIFQHVSVCMVAYTSFIDRSFLPMVPLTPMALPMVPLAPLAADTDYEAMVTNGTNGTNGLPVAKLPMIPLAEFRT